MIHYEVHCAFDEIQAEISTESVINWYCFSPALGAGGLAGITPACIILCINTALDMLGLSPGIGAWTMAGWPRPVMGIPKVVGGGPRGKVVGVVWGTLDRKGLAGGRCASPGVDFGGWDWSAGIPLAPTMGRWSGCDSGGVGMVPAAGCGPIGGDTMAGPGPGDNSN